MTWTIQKARDTYDIAHWSNGYFDISDRGELVCKPDPRAAHPGISLTALVRACECILYLTELSVEATYAAGGSARRC